MWEEDREQEEYEQRLMPEISPCLCLHDEVTPACARCVSSNKHMHLDG